MKKTTLKFFLTAALMALMFACGPNDEKIAAAVNTALAANPGLSAVVASVKDGVVTLSGEVENDDLKALAESNLSDVKGIKNINNALTVKPQGPSPEELKKMADDALLQKVKDNFSTYKVAGITATVVDGVVTLTGEIKRANLQNAMKAAMESGAAKVENQMTIKK